MIDPGMMDAGPDLEFGPDDDFGQDGAGGFATPKPTMAYRDWLDTASTRTAMREAAMSALEGREVANATHKLRFSGVSIGDRRFTKADEKKAIGARGTLHSPIRATAEFQTIDGRLIQKKPVVVGYLPHITDRGTMVVNGTSYVAYNQTRLRPGAYQRMTASGEPEAQFNIAPSTGRGFHIGMEPSTGVFRLRVGQAASKLYPVLRRLGVSDDDLRKQWGDDVLEANRLDDMKSAKELKRLYARFDIDESLDDQTAGAALAEKFGAMRVDPEVMEFTQGRATDRVDNRALLDATTNLIKLNRGERESDDRDSIAFQSIHGPEDFVGERLRRDAGGVLRRALWSAAGSGNLDKMRDGFGRDLIYSLFQSSGLVHAAEDINPAEIADLRRKITRLGDGGLSDTRASPRESRGVQASHLGIIDPLKVPENASLGLDLRATHGTFKGKDNRIYVTVLPREAALLPPDRRKTVVVPAIDLLRKPIGFPGEIDDNGDGKVRAMVRGKITYVDRNEVGHWLPSPESEYTMSTNLVPLIGNTKAQRVSMGSRMVAQALPLEAGEAPFVRSALPGDTTRSFYELAGDEAGAIRSTKGGMVMKVTKDAVTVLTPDGDTEEHDLYDNLPLNRKTGLSQTAAVKPGDRLDPGGLVATSNFTDKKGALAVGRNLNVGYMAYDGLIFEDAAVISRSAASKLKSQHLYQHERKFNDNTHSVKTGDFVGMFPGVFTKDQLHMLDDDGVAKPGTVLKKGDPLLLNIQTKPNKGVGALTRNDRSHFSDRSELWEHDDPGVVVDVFRRGKDTTVTVATMRSMNEGDKLSGRFGDKHVVSKIVEDDDMPRGEDGTPLDVIVSPTGMASRINPSQLIEGAMGKIAARTGQHINMPSFSKTDGVEDAIAALKKAGISDTETLTDPVNGRLIPNVFVGNRYYMRLHHIAEDKMSAREVDDYTSDDTPAKGGFTGAKRLASLETLSLLSHGAVDFLRDTKMVRGQRNDDYWRGVRLGLNPKAPMTSAATEKFFHSLRAAGVNVDRQDDNIYISPLTDRGVDDLAKGRTITTADTFNWDSMEPKVGGLFDVGNTGGTDGRLWSKFALPVPVPNPIAEESIRRILGMTQPQFRAVLGGQADINGIKGPQGVLAALKGYDNRLDAEVAETKNRVSNSRGAGRDAAVKRLGFLIGLQRMGVKPSELMLSKVPILPPKFRPISQAGGMTMVADPNYLYAEMISSAQNYVQAKDSLGDDEAHTNALTLYDTVKAVTGLGDPVSRTLQDKNVKGILKTAVGVGRSPKLAAFQRRVIGNAVDTVGRGVIAPDPKLGIDEVGVPRRMAWEIFKPYVVRTLVQRGMPALQAAQAVLQQNHDATQALDEVVAKYPVMYTRAPALHRHSMVGGYAKLVDGDTIRLPLPVEKGMTADHDGDQINVHVPSTADGRADVINKLMPSKNLLSPATFEAHMVPDVDIAHGIWVASKKRSKRPVRTFKDEESAVAAYMRGELGATDPVRIAKT